MYIMAHTRQTSRLPFRGGLVGYILLVLLLPACREEVEVFRPETEPAGTPGHTDYAGFFLLNQQYEVVANYPMPGRNYKLTVRCTL